jgi:hypothetical protein
MAAGCAIAAHDNAFNRGILGDSALYFTAEGAREQLAAAWTQRGTLLRDTVRLLNEDTVGPWSLSSTMRH